MSFFKVPTLERWVHSVYWTLFSVIFLFLVEAVLAECGFTPIADANAAHRLDWAHPMPLFEGLFDSRHPDHELGMAGLGTTTLLLFPVALWIGKWSPRLRKTGIVLFCLLPVWAILFPRLG